MASTNYHTPITGTPDIRTGINTALGALDAAVGEIGPQAASFGVQMADTLNNLTAAATTWTNQIRGYNSYEVDADGIVVPASNEFTPAVGTYVLIARHTYGGSTASTARLRLYNITQDSDDGYGLCVKTEGGQQMMTIMGIFTANGTDTYQLQVYVNALNTADLGLAHSIGTNETYMQFMLIRIATS